MKNFNNKSLFNLIKSKGLLLIAGSSLLTSCIVYTGGYSETDGVYYDPNKDTLPAGTYGGNFGNQVDDYYNYPLRDQNIDLLKLIGYPENEIKEKLKDNKKKPMTAKKRTISASTPVNPSPCIAIIPNVQTILINTSPQKSQFA